MVRAGVESTVRAATKVTSAYLFGRTLGALVVMRAVAVLGFFMRRVVPGPLAAFGRPRGPEPLTGH